MSKILDTRNRAIERRAVAFERALLRWMRKAGRAMVVDELRRAQGAMSKALDSGLVAELAALIYRYGVAAAEGGLYYAGTTAPKWAFRGSSAQDALRTKEFKLQVFEELQGWATTRATEIAESTKEQVRDSVRDIIDEALEEEPTPSAGEIARRIRTQVAGQDEEGRVYAFSSERAALIARTELVQAQNTGEVAGFEQLGAKRLRWLAYRDGFSGDRHHELMHGKEVEIGDRFVTPLGNELRYPGDPEAPIKETANCRCSVVPVYEGET